jgi:hypothetical protein
MKLSRNAVTAGVAALCLAVSASPALAQGGSGGGGSGGGGGTTTTSTSGGGGGGVNSGGGGGGGGGGSVSCVVIGGGGGCNGPKPTCTRTLIDPVMQVFVVTCTP